jgi:hypoxanthine phosphoribosyltransferase
MNNDTILVPIKWNEVENYCQTLYNAMNMDNYQPEIIVGLLRGGVIPARIMADYFSVTLDFYTIDVKYYTGINQTLDKPVIRHLENFDYGKSILIIEDIYDSGKTMQAVLDILPKENIKTATLHCRENISNPPTYFAETALKDEWIVYPWEKIEFKNTSKER